MQCPLGEKELQSYLVTEIQKVYRLQGVGINVLVPPVASSSTVFVR